MLPVMLDVNGVRVDAFDEGMLNAHLAFLRRRRPGWAWLYTPEHGMLGFATDGEGGSLRFVPDAAGRHAGFDASRDGSVVLPAEEILLAVVHFARTGEPAPWLDWTPRQTGATA